MSDQTPPTDAPASGGYPPPQTPPAAPPVTPPVAPPVPPYPSAHQPTAPYPGAPTNPYQGAPYQQGSPYQASSPYQGTAGGQPAAYGAPYGAGYPSAYTGAARPEPAPAGPGGLGLVALLLSLVAAIGAPIVGSIAAFQVALGTASQFGSMPSDAFDDLSFLSPVRDWVLLGEISFWAGTVLGIWAIVQGIVAIVKRRGRGTGIAAIVVAVVAVFIFGTVVYIAAIAGVATGAAVYA